MKFQSSKGFTLIELLVVIAIIGVLASTVLASVNSARGKARIARARADLYQLRQAVFFLENDSGQHPNHNPIEPCQQDPEIYLDQPGAGIQSTDGTFPNWQGPYMSRVPLDPWEIAIFLMLITHVMVILVARVFPMAQCYEWSSPAGQMEAE